MYLNKKHRGVNEKALAMKCIVKLYIINKNTDNFKMWVYLLRQMYLIKALLTRNPHMKYSIKSS